MARTTTFTSWARTACGLLASALARLALGCGASDEDARQGVAPTPSPAHFTIDFEAFPLGAPVRPLAVSAHGPSAARVIATPDHGRVLEVQGDPTPGAFAVTRYDGAAVSGDVSLRFEVNPAAGASFVAWIRATGGVGAARHQLRVMRAPGSTTLMAAGSRGTVACAALPSGQWSTVTVAVHGGDARTFDVEVNATPTACAGLATDLAPPVVGVAVMDASNDRWGGRTLFDNFALF
jgi:hypothetical protein